ncbi:MAG: tryptophan 2,3-dioxygenase [Limnohabitans sp.]|nr:tryptophan 2,3-dioxygenase [Limnohabitans sp.]
MECPFDSKDSDHLVDGALLNFSNEMSYGDYLNLNGLLNSQKLLSMNHNEMLFIIQHQTSELWMKLILHELNETVHCISNDQLCEALKMLSRVCKVMSQLVQSWDVLSSMTPSEYSKFRPALANSSGFQSFQYRRIEFILGNKNLIMIKPYFHFKDWFDQLQATLNKPSLYDETLRLLSRNGLQIPDSYLNRDWTQPYAPSDQVERAWLQIYQSPETYWDLYELGEKLTDLEDLFRTWRFRHVTTVERVIGFKRGTGGTSGVGYLKKKLDVVLFPELWTVRTHL